MTYPSREGALGHRRRPHGVRRLYSFRWHPDAVEPGLDYEAEPSTLVEFILEDAPGGTLLSIVESGFDSIPLERRAKAFSGNSEGWDMQLKALEAYVGA